MHPPGAAPSPLPVDPKRSILAGMVVVLIAMGGFIVWAATAPLAEAVVAAGTIKVDSNRKKIQHLEGGTIKDILVRDGDKVSTGDVLVRLDETRAAASLAILRDGYDVAVAQEARLLSERDGAEDIQFPRSFTERSGEPTISEIMTSQRALWQARREAVAGEVAILEKQIAGLQQDVDGRKAQVRSENKQLVFVRDELASVRKLHQKGLGGKQRVLELERESARLEGSRAEHQSEIATAQTEMSRKELEIHQVRAAFREKVVSELKQVQAEIFDYRERMNAAEHVYKQTEVRSPVDGVVVDIGVHTIGGVVSPGETLLELLPSNDELIIEARVNPQDIDKVTVGLPAAIRMTAFNQRTTPELDGQLRYVSADALLDNKTGETYFISRVEVPLEQVERLGDKQILPGMMAEVFIRTGERTMADYLLQPIHDSFRRAWLED